MAQRGKGSETHGEAARRKRLVPIRPATDMRFYALNSDGEAMQRMELYSKEMEVHRKGKRSKGSDSQGKAVEGRGRARNGLA